MGKKEAYKEIIRLHDSNKSYGLMFAGMEDSDVDRVVNAVRQLCAQYQ